MPLFLAPQGEAVKIVRVSADSKTLKRLGDMGVIPGAELTLLSCANGNAVVNVRGSRIALDRNIARSIIVRQQTVA